MAVSLLSDIFQTDFQNGKLPPDCIHIVIEKPSAQAQSGPVQHASPELEKAFGISFRDPVGYLSALSRRIHEVENAQGHFNYLTIIQSSGYGKTRAGRELAAKFPFVYVCFRESGSTGYPPATPKSMDILGNINAAKDVDEAETHALNWIRSIISTFHVKKEEYLKKQPQPKENYQQTLLKDMVIDKP
jgi:hypothetical protein